MKRKLSYSVAWLVSGNCNIYIKAKSNEIKSYRSPVRKFQTFNAINKIWEIKHTYFLFIYVRMKIYIFRYYSDIRDVIIRLLCNTNCKSYYATKININVRC